MRVLAVDFGERRIGLAVSDSTATLARPLEVVAGSADPVRAASAVLAAIAAFEKADERIDTIVVGLPTRLDGSPNEQTARVTAFAADLERRGARPVVLRNERLTSHEADSLLAEREGNWRIRKQKLDAAAAAVILQEYLDHQRGNQ
jgi:putative holliday junction resolvase